MSTYSVKRAFFARLISPFLILGLMVGPSPAYACPELCRRTLRPELSPAVKAGLEQSLKEGEEGSDNSGLRRTLLKGQEIVFWRLDPENPRGRIIRVIFEGREGHRGRVSFLADETIGFIAESEWNPGVPPSPGNIGGPAWTLEPEKRQQADPPIAGVGVVVYDLKRNKGIGTVYLRRWVRNSRAEFRFAVDPTILLATGEEYGGQDRPAADGFMAGLEGGESPLPSRSLLVASEPLPADRLATSNQQLATGLNAAGLEGQTSGERAVSAIVQTLSADEVVQSLWMRANEDGSIQMVAVLQHGVDEERIREWSHGALVQSQRIWTLGENLGFRPFRIQAWRLDEPPSEYGFAQIYERGDESPAAGLEGMVQRLAPYVPQTAAVPFTTWESLKAYLQQHRGVLERANHEALIASGEMPPGTEPSALAHQTLLAAFREAGWAVGVDQSWVRAASGLDLNQRLEPYLRQHPLPQPPVQWAGFRQWYLKNRAGVAQANWKMLKPAKPIPKNYFLAPVTVGLALLEAGHLPAGLRGQINNYGVHLNYVLNHEPLLRAQLIEVLHPLDPTEFPVHSASRLRSAIREGLHFDQLPRVTSEEVQADIAALQAAYQGGHTTPRAAAQAAGRTVRRAQQLWPYVTEAKVFVPGTYADNPKAARALLTELLAVPWAQELIAQWRSGTLPPAAGLEEPEVLSGLSENMNAFWKRFLQHYNETNPGDVFPPRHASTLLMLGAMERLKSLFDNAEVLDTGAGSGILGLASLAAPGFGARKVTTTEPPSKIGEVIRANALFLGVEDRLEFSAGSLLETVRGHRFNVALHNAAGYWEAVGYLKGIKEVLEPDGVALLLWESVSEEYLRNAIQDRGLTLEPLFRTPDSGWQVYAITRTDARMKEVLSLARPGMASEAPPPSGEGKGLSSAAGLEDGVAPGEEVEHLEGDSVDPETSFIRWVLRERYGELGRDRLLPGVERLTRVLRGNRRVDPDLELLSLLHGLSIAATDFLERHPPQEAADRFSQLLDWSVDLLEKDRLGADPDQVLDILLRTGVPSAGGAASSAGEFRENLEQLGRLLDAGAHRLLSYADHLDFLLNAYNRLPEEDRAGTPEVYQWDMKGLAAELVRMISEVEEAIARQRHLGASAQVPSATDNGSSSQAVAAVLAGSQPSVRIPADSVGDDWLTWALVMEAVAGGLNIEDHPLMAHRDEKPYFLISRRPPDAQGGLEERQFTRRRFLKAVVAAAAAGLLPRTIPAVDQPPTRPLTFGELVGEIQEELRRRSSEVLGQIPRGVGIMPLSDTPLGQDLSNRVPAGYEGQGLFAVSTAASGRPAPEQVVRSVYFPPRLLTPEVRGRYAEDLRYRLAEHSDAADAVVVDRETPNRELLLAQGKILFEVNSQEDANSLTPALIDRLTAQDLILPGVGTLIVIQSLTAPGFEEVVLIFV